MTTMTQPTTTITLLESALAYAARGWPVFPLVPRTKLPLTQNGFKSATTDTEQITRWWTATPDANIGVPTGERSGITVLDVDVKPWKNQHGDETLGALLAEHGSLPATLEQTTWSGGTQFIFRYEPGVRNSSGKLGPALDIRGEGGYVVVPPSYVHEDGREGTYSWRVLLPPETMPLAAMPDWIVARLRTTDREPQAERPTLRTTRASGASVRIGQRNAHLAHLAGVMRRPGISEDGILAALRVENQTRCVPPLADAEVCRIANSITRYAPSDKATAPHLTDLGNASRLVAAHGADLRFVSLWSQWLVWDGTRWAKDETGEVHRRAKDTVRRMYAEAMMLDDSKEREVLGKHATASENEKRISSMIALARTEPEVVVKPDALDADHWLLNCTNGTLDLRTGTLRPHDRTDRITKLAPVVYDASARCDRWLAFLEQIFEGDGDLIRYMQKVIGFSLTGTTLDHALFMAYGSGANGKSTLFKTVATMLGDYAQNARSQTLMLKRTDSGATPEIARLHGARFVLAVEAEAGKHLAEGLVKGLTGGDRVVARNLYQGEFEFEPTHKLFLAVNHKPRIGGTDYGIWRRVHLIPFTVTIPGRSRTRPYPTSSATSCPASCAGPSRVAGCGRPRGSRGRPPSRTRPPSTGPSRTPWPGSWTRSAQSATDTWSPRRSCTPATRGGVAVRVRSG
jgi:putative DNA primase/helicase